MPKDILINSKEISAFSGEKKLEKAEFKDGSSLPVSGVFVAVGVAGSGDFARKLGAQIDGTKIVVDSNMATNIPGLFAAGDCTGGMLQVAKAVYEGAKAGTEAVKYVRSLKKQ
jgi:thioredoxin reductase (NADPH)